MTSTTKVKYFNNNKNRSRGIMLLGRFIGDTKQKILFDPDNTNHCILPTMKVGKYEGLLTATYQ